MVNNLILNDKRTSEQVLSLTIYPRGTANCGLERSICSCRSSPWVIERGSFFFFFYNWCMQVFFYSKTGLQLIIPYFSVRATDLFSHIFFSDSLIFGFSNFHKFYFFKIAFGYIHKPHQTLNYCLISHTFVSKKKKNIYLSNYD